MIIGQLVTGEKVHRYNKSIVINFSGKRKVLSNSPENGGMRGDLTAVFNNDCTANREIDASGYAEYILSLSRELELDPAKTAGMITAAQMENVSIKSVSYKDITVTAIVTGSLETNGGRVGDPASWDELANEIVAEQGTINIMLFINTNLTDGALTRALITCTEAKTAAIQELMAPSKYSKGLATGSGTDSTIIVCNSESDTTLTDAGNHVKLGECIGKVVIGSVKEALKLQSGLCPVSQHDVFKRISRFGITPKTLWNSFCEQSPSDIKEARFTNILAILKNDSTLVTGTSLYVHLLDQITWGLIDLSEADNYADSLLEKMSMSVVRSDENKQNPTDFLTSKLELGLLNLIRDKADL